MKTVIIDYGMGNLGSVQRAIEACGASCIVTSNPDDLTEASHIILPGVGAFKEGMVQLNQRGWNSAILKAVTENKTPLLGICLGMQLLADIGFEGGQTAGLGLIPGQVCLLEPHSQKERVPHVGWNEIIKVGLNPLFTEIPDGSDFYFVHSYHFKAKESPDIIATTPYCGVFYSAVARNNVFGVQFHPEKSQRFGFQLLKNFLSQ